MSDNKFECQASDDYFETITEASMWGVFRSEDDPGGGLVAAFEKHAEAKDYVECSENEFLCVLPMTLTGEYCNRDDDDASALASRHPQLQWDMPSTGTESAAQLSGPVLKGGK